MSTHTSHTSAREALAVIGDELIHLCRLTATPVHIIGLAGRRHPNTLPADITAFTNTAFTNTAFTDTELIDRAHLILEIDGHRTRISVNHDTLTCAPEPETGTANTDDMLTTHYVDFVPDLDNPTLMRATVTEIMRTVHTRETFTQPF